MPEYNIKRVRDFLHKAEDMLNNKRMPPYFEIPLFDKNASDKLEDERGRVLDNLNNRAKALDALARIRTALLKKEVESGLIDLEYERASAQSYLDEANALVWVYRNKDDTTIPSSFTEFDEAKSMKVKFTLLTEEGASYLEEQMDTAKEVLKEMDYGIDELQVNTKIVLDDSYLNPIKIIGVVP